MRQVVVVGGTSDTATVLKAVFEPRGATVQRSRSANRPKSSSTEVVVIDLDTDANTESSPYKVLIGSHIPAAVNPSERFLTKPFQYPELVKAIEELLDASPAA